VSGANISDVAKVVFSADSPIVGLNPLEDTDGSDGFATMATALAIGGPVHITAQIYLTGDLVTPKCSAAATITEIVPPSSWWQTKEGDVWAITDITSQIPPTAPDPQLATGVVFYGSSLDLGAGNTPWPVNLALPAVDTYDQLKGRFANLVSECDPDKMTTGNYYCSNQLEVKKDWNLGSQKIVVFVDRDIQIKNPITVASGGFLLLATAQNLQINKKVTNLQGFYFAQGNVETDKDKETLTLAGSLIAGGVTFQREAKTLTDPAELFIFRPDLWLNSPQELWTATKTWQELAP
jgi:hypothetical protein